jgi:hypothetical protein
MENYSLLGNGRRRENYLMGEKLYPPKMLFASSR